MNFCLRDKILLSMIFPALLSGCNNTGTYLKSSESTTGASVLTAEVPKNNKSQTVISSDNRTLYTSSEKKNSSFDKETLSNSALNNCRAELSTLSLINRASWSKRRAAFDALLRNAAVYARVRQDVDSQTRDTLDSLYQYRTRQLCLRIQQDVAEGLMRRAEDLTGQ